MNCRLIQISPLVVVLLLTFFPAVAQDAIFQTSNYSVRNVMSADQTALVGEIGFIVATGTTGAGSIILQFPVEITNLDTADIVVVGTGDLAVTALDVGDTDLSEGIVAIAVPVGGDPNDVITINGIRVDAANDDVSGLMVSIGGSGAGTFVRNEVEVVDSALTGMSVDPDSALSFSYAAGSLFSDPIGEIIINEGFDGAFTDDIGTFGQNVATQIRLEVNGLLDEGSKLTFSDTVAEPKTGATLDLIPSSEGTLPTEEGELSVTYAFTSGADSLVSTEAFTIPFSLEVETPPGEPQIVFVQATLSPSGKSDVPRYAEQIIPPQEEIPLPEFDTFVPVVVEFGQFMGFALTNLSGFDIPIEFLALTVEGQPAEGATVTNPASFTIQAKGQFAAVLPEIFGSGIQDANPATVIVHSRIVEPVILFLVGDNENTLLDGTIFDQQALKAFALPSLGREGLGPFTKVYAFNPSGETTSELTLTLHDLAGTPVAAREFELGPQETVSGELSDLLEVDIASFSGGYIRGQADEPVLAFESFGSEDALSNLNAQSLGILEDIYRIPHFAVGAGFDTEVNLVNLDVAETASLQVSAYDDDGQPLPIPGANQFSVEPGDLPPRVVPPFKLELESFEVQPIPATS